MPPDPNARRDKILEGILGELRKTNSLLATQNKIAERMEKHARPTAFTHHPYLERTDGDAGPGADGPEGDAGTAGEVQGGFQGGDPDSAR